MLFDVGDVVDWRADVPPAIKETMVIGVPPFIIVSIKTVDVHFLRILSGNGQFLSLKDVRGRLIQELDTPIMFAGGMFRLVEFSD